VEEGDVKQLKRKRHKRQKSPSGMILQPRDIDVMEAVYRFRVLSQAQIATLFFGSKATAQFRLEKLYDHQFLERKFLPVSLGDGRSPTLYVLDRKGAETLRTERGYDEVKWFGTSKGLSADFLSHTMAINDVMVRVSLACRVHGFTLEKWQAENEVKADYDRVRVQSSQGKWEDVPVVPDSFFTIVAHQRRYPFVLELDRGTMTLARFKNKIRAYVVYFQSGAYEKRYGVKSLRVLSVVSTKSQSGGEKRRDNLKAATEELTRERWFWFATLAELTPENILTIPIWHQASEQDRKILVAPI